MAWFEVGLHPDRHPFPETRLQAHGSPHCTSSSATLPVDLLLGGESPSPPRIVSRLAIQRLVVAEREVLLRIHVLTRPPGLVSTLDALHSQHLVQGVGEHLPVVHRVLRTVDGARLRVTAHVMGSSHGVLRGIQQYGNGVGVSRTSASPRFENHHSRTLPSFPRKRESRGGGGG